MPDSRALNPTPRDIPGHGGVSIRVWDYGGKGPALVLAHCTGTLSRLWDPLVPRLLPKFHVYAHDTRGHGDSGKPRDSDAYTWINTGRDLVAMIDALGLSRPILGVGHSAGAAQIAYAEWLRPGTFSKAVLIDPIIGPAGFFRADNPLAEAARRRRSVFESREVARARWASRPPLGAWDPRALDAYVTHGLRDRDDGQVELKCPPEIESQIFARSGSTDLFERLGDLDLDVTLVTSDNSNVRQLALLQRPRYRRCTFIELQGPTHFIPQEVPDEVAGIILNALSN
jgi:pimeloyl-ACP methyl ester carboxylesterase